MSVVFVVGSEEQLSSGAAWCELIAESSGTPIHVVVLGADRNTLAELAKRKLTEHIDLPHDQIEVALIEPKASAVNEHLRTIACKSLLLVYQGTEREFQQEVFEQSTVATIWVRIEGPPPASSSHVLEMFRGPSQITKIAAKSILGLSPSDPVVESTEREPTPTIDATLAAIESQERRATDLVVCGFQEPRAEDEKEIYRTALQLIQQSTTTSVALVHTGDTLVESLAGRVRRWSDSVAPPMERDQRIELSQDLQGGSQPNLEFLGLISASSMLAAFGLLQDSAAVIIGAMLIAPLMTPILGAGLALTQGNRPLFKSALWTITLGFVAALVASMVFGWLYWLLQGIPDPTDEMWARCRPSPLDFCVGMVGGIAASYARTRTHLSSALAGAAIAAALVPPIATAGLQIAFMNWTTSDRGAPVIGPLILVSVNVLMIMIGSSFVLWARGMRSDRVSTRKDRWTLRMFALLLMLGLLILIWEM